jgi:ribosomal protein S18 acetylase RimI-like enzyme
VLVLRMRCVIPPLPAPSFPDGVRVRTWRAGDAAAVHGLLVDAYSRGGGDVQAYEPWRECFTNDTEFDPEACLIALGAGGVIAGVALCWSTGFVKDLCVAEPYRRQGLGEALLREQAVRFRRRGVDELELKADGSNAVALRLYERLGFRVVERLHDGPPR